MARWHPTKEEEALLRGMDLIGGFLGQAEICSFISFARRYLGVGILTMVPEIMILEAFLAYNFYASEKETSEWFDGN